MSDLIMQLAGVIQRDVDSLKGVSQNVANANTYGYKAERTFNVMGTDATGIGVQGGLDDIQAQTSINADGGALQFTGRVTDLSLSGDAWFAMKTPDGVVLSRDGRFQVDNAGYLVSKAGYPVLAEGGPLQVSGGVLKVDAGGQVSVDDRPIGRLDIVRVDQPRQLLPIGAGLYVATSKVIPARDYVVHQGLLERSNAAMSTDMVKMMEVSRHVETMQRALSAYDGMLNSGINQIGKN
ncbi:MULTISPECIES: flagellar hook-basal body protein [Pseudomonas]|uniref:Flagellar basal body rod protein FlgG n=2 Tax=Pseudomonas TaxID=286 RepID=A0A0G3G614_9PSED|nr:flagellar hook basal-body protein [Pseudomonas fluorescens]AKJ96675.1 flagellar basal body rod protein FlgG [Pseudomonas chlororaphis]KIQ61301.1 flagellar basal body rod protein FlgG [Pseudomonas fluorescens]